MTLDFSYQFYSETIKKKYRFQKKEEIDCELCLFKSSQVYVIYLRFFFENNFQKQSKKEKILSF